MSRLKRWSYLAQDSKEYHRKALLISFHLRSHTYFFVFCLGGLGEAVIAVVAKEKGVIVETLAVREIPRSGPGDVLIDHYGIGAKTIVKTVKSM